MKYDKKHDDEVARVVPFSVEGARQDLPRRGHGVIPTDEELDDLAMADLGIAEYLLECAQLRALLKRYLDNHCAAADAEGMSTLCECRLCLDTRAVLSAAQGEPPPTNAVDPHAQPSGTPTPRGKASS